ncbi:tRNA (adenosine(37)-N6)-threonylcarbamoyltransferase complex dimerization subunit type 1 TsaB [Rhodoferax sp.]|uniref:tRNA (adenosine(37)-N6)-threonylcarbamoyltransferase complex dimerization subunit type 1 TsaB n=1 Tax=Rhodoferax sp. TaxID=50421 RepID=UPI0008CE3493|nr:tRNA (adenosine(37)-N6)-threonylcarbamoyltransferase complex dimerization subunit type 1 TsaB [Rhodoferax sp.]OGB42424.1 MAG: tRNA (adenosine(37)-N6)-threonylcarbamoyltransferase complex dimerization subunit type 1 TsaB [Burkholderiales bacterium RIFOXYC2_FULL_59_8]OGB52018.1 MAG: tRNA (adenosine(37)-N6)-threonylcarbamoyltransferase complex dimerization subunit type 1 TsaB [Burkholderiales bacterium RIFOXYD12_FULL_59_19]OGB80549.1 MAG: tRNA (adenosine(37)-N6)-threonylcarbamoyltransferase comp
MNLLAFDTSTDLMSIAVQRGSADAEVLWQHQAAGGALTSSHLIPEIQRLMTLAGLDFGALDAIVFGAGPGSFTGLRTACSVAQGLGFGATVPVLPVDTLLAVAEEARWLSADTRTFAVSAMLDARMDECYTTNYVFDDGAWKQQGPYRLLKPEQLHWNGSHVLAGNVFGAYGARLPERATRITAMPTATALLRLAPGLLAFGAGVPAEQALPTYIRDKVAQTTHERAVAKALAGATP